MIYYILAFSIFIFSVYDISRERNIAKSNILLGQFIFFSFTLLLIVLGGIRWERGTDWQNYYNFFMMNTTWEEYSNGNGGEGTFEVLYAFLNFFVKIFSNSYTTFLCVLSFLVIILKYNIIKKVGLYPALSFYLFFCTNIGDIFPVRQSLAISMLLTSIYFIQKKKMLPFVCIVLIASLIHNSAILWIFSYYIYNKNFSSIFIIISLILSFLIGLNGRIVFSQIINILLMPLESSGRIVSRIIYYTFDYSNSSFSINQVVISVIKRMLFIPIFLIIRNKIKNNNDNKYILGLFNLYFFGNAIYLLFINDLTVFQRMTSPYLLLEIFIFPSLLKIIKKRYYKYLFLFILLLYGLLKLYTALNTYDVFIPYRSVFN
jgi:hypothetical protein